MSYIGKRISTAPILLCKEPLQEGTEHALLISNQCSGILLFRRGFFMDRNTDTFAMLVQSCGDIITERLSSIWITQEELLELDKSRQTVIVC